MVRGVRFPLPLLLVLFGLPHPLWAVPPGLTKAQWFAIQHVQPNPLPCNGAMFRVNSFLNDCKPTNSFLHKSYQNVAVTCAMPSINCSNGEPNCHRSANPVNLTLCRLTGGAFPNCSYSTRPQLRRFIVACEVRQPGDPRSPLVVPVHLEF